MSMETFELLEPFFSSADLVFLQGWGEPLLHPQIWEMARRVRSAGARVGFTTNGILLDEANRKALLNSGLGILGVSLAGATPGTHDRFRRGSPLETIDLNLVRLKREKEAAGSQFPEIHLAYQLLADNIDEVQGVVELAHRWGATQIVMSNLSFVLSPTLEQQALLSRPEGWPGIRDRLEKVRTQAENEGLHFYAYTPRGRGAEPVCTENVLKSCFVSVLGDVSPCVMTNLGLEGEARAAHWFRGGEHPIQTIVFGNVADQSLREIWQSKIAREFRDLFRERLWQGSRGTQGLPSPCRHCYKLFES